MEIEAIDYFDDSDPELVNSNGSRYLVGYDDYGFFSIVPVNVYVDEDETAHVESQAGARPVGLTPPLAEDIAEMIDSGP